MMDAKTLVLDMLRSLGRREAAELRESAAGMDGTAIIAMERAVPAWDKQQDYTGWPVGSPVDAHYPAPRRRLRGPPQHVAGVVGTDPHQGCHSGQAVGRPCRSEWHVHDR